MRPSSLAVFLLIFLGPCSSSKLDAQSAAAIEPHTQAAVIAADDAWGKAEEKGDVRFLDDLLLPEYRSIGTNGSIHGKADIIAGASKPSPDRPAKVAAWKATHPSITSVQINGDTAVVTFELNKPDTPKAILSCDIFLYRNGHWHAIYSQHTTAGA